ncbi:glycosyltransferase family 4 protein [Sphingomonas humi]|uniref:Glycosyltransferase n=1 Tax=Sphingomonas humi TaxID=335630 RepID=A0ABP7RQ53_9SPHN
MLRIGYLINRYPWPSHTFIRTEMRELERQGHEVARLAVRGWDDAQGSALDEEEQKLTDYVLQSGALGLLASAAGLLLRSPLAFARGLAATLRLARGSQAGLKHIAYFLEACWVVGWSRRRGVAHLHAHFGTNTAIVATIVHALCGLPFSFTVHGPEEFDAPRQLKLREKAAAASFVVAITSYCRSQLYRWVDPQDWPKIKIVRCTPEPTFLVAAPTPPPAAKRLVCVGRLCEQKGQLKLIEALERLGDKHPDLKLVLAGEGPMRPELEHAVAKASLGERVTITGWINSERVMGELLAADALVLPSFAEGLPVVIMEAMALGRPVISTLIAGIPELVRDGVDGFLVPAGDSDLLADAIDRFLALSNGERQRLAAAASERVRERHQPAREAAYLAELALSGGKAERD